MGQNRISRIFVAGHRGMVGSAIIRHLRVLGQYQLLTADRSELDLCCQAQVEEYFRDHDINQVYLAAAKVGGIQANDRYPADFLYRNLMIEANVINAAYNAGIDRLLFLGSSCIYPRMAEQPMREEVLLNGPLEPTNEAYAIAKIAGIKLCESYQRQYGCDFRSVMPTNLYGPGDNFHHEDSHVIPGLLRRFHEAQQLGASTVTVWGSGTPRREFLHVDDLAIASVHVMNLQRERYATQTTPRRSHLNVGTGRDCSIRELAELIAQITGFAGEMHFDASKPDGTPRKMLDVSRLQALGWQPRISLSEGLHDTYRWYLSQLNADRGVYNSGACAIRGA
ncbi:MULTISPECIES: GDP-L-fucose synthase [Halomonadaceae]|uniref:GDP-L-fucose synthase n=1 Tax=Billgrantia aerodenitrificans TaxID=2733483 RepID=A0ABS9AVZ6_9GAMM|nr:MULTISPECIES: GDP-L-fucose synthase [Halomonas]MCE8025889.1 GDP-L-fucose synthase [Halomonas aerodenitrificans]